MESLKEMATGRGQEGTIVLDRYLNEGKRATYEVNSSLEDIV